MTPEPFDWNVVVVGYWNPAILTPRGIARRLFGLEPGTPVAVEVPMDGLAPHRVRHKRLVVVAEQNRLAITPEVPSLEELQRARQIAVRAMENLPETPVTAAGYNIRLRFNEPPSQLLEVTSSKMDGILSDANLTINGVSVRRSIIHGEGLINLEIRQEDDADLTIEFNFHRQSMDMEELVAWLNMPPEDTRSACALILDKLAGTQFEEAWL